MENRIPRIEKAYVHYSNDPSVGMFAYGFEIELNLDTQDLHEINDARTRILDLYEFLEGERPDYCQFDFELKAEIEQEAEMDRQRAEAELSESELIEDKELAADLAWSMDDKDYFERANQRAIKSMI